METKALKYLRWYGTSGDNNVDKSTLHMSNQNNVTGLEFLRFFQYFPKICVYIFLER